MAGRTVPAAEGMAAGEVGTGWPAALALETLGLPETVLAAYEELGVHQLHDWQAEALATPGVLSGGGLCRGLRARLPKPTAGCIRVWPRSSLTLTTAEFGRGRLRRRQRRPAPSSHAHWGPTAPRCHPPTETNLAYTAPTSGGKTLVSEVLLIKRLLQGGSRSKALFLLPYRATVAEKARHFRRLLQGTSVRAHGRHGLQQQ